MKLNQFKFLTNRFILAILIFLVWIIFIDDNSLLYLRDLDRQIQQLEDKKNFYKEGIKKQKQTLKDLNDDRQLQKYAREKLLLKKEGEDIYLIETSK